MSDIVAGTLDALAPVQPFDPDDWHKVLSSAGIRHGQRRSLARPRTLLLAAAVVIGILLPLGTLGATDGWWFDRVPIIDETATLSTTTTALTPSGTTASPSEPVPLAPAVAPAAVKSGSWDGQNWELDAFVGAGGDLCFGVSPSATAHGNGLGAALNCARIYGVPQPPGEAQTVLPLDITYLIGGRSPDLPAYVAGPVVGSARTVVVYFSDGEILRTETFEAPSNFGSIRFYAAPIPDAVATRYLKPPPGPVSPFSKIVGLDENGAIVACLRTPTMEGGMPPSACR
jgi:hypothetical protein